MKTILMIATIVVGSIAVGGAGLVAYGSFMLKDSEDAPEIQAARNTLQVEKLALRRQKLQQHSSSARSVGLWGMVALVSVGSLGITGIIFAACYGVVWVRVKSIVPQMIGQKTVLLQASTLKDPRFAAYVAGLVALEGTQTQDAHVVAQMAQDFLKPLPQMSGKIPAMSKSKPQPLRNC
jgi:hypothetical protein